jgi:hypothetical protein
MSVFKSDTITKKSPTESTFLIATLISLIYSYLISQRNVPLDCSQDGIELTILVVWKFKFIGGFWVRLM